MTCLNDVELLFSHISAICFAYWSNYVLQVYLIHVNDIYILGCWWKVISNMLSHGSWFLLQTLLCQVSCNFLEYFILFYQSCMRHNVHNQWWFHHLRPIRYEKFEGKQFSLSDAEYIVFHSPYNKVQIPSGCKIHFVNLF